MHPSQVKKNSGAQVGDKLILGKPLGVGILSAALKKQKLDQAGYADMIANTTKLNKPGQELAKLTSVHALTDVTGFGLLGHLLEICRGANVSATLPFQDIPLLPQVMALAHAGNITGASARNWSAYGHDVSLHNITDIEKALLTDPQTSGGLLVSCSADAVDAVLALFHRHDFMSATVIGEITEKNANSFITVTSSN